MFLVIENLTFLALGCLLFSVYIGYRFSWPAALAFFVTCISGLRMADSLNSGLALAEFLICVVSVLFVNNYALYRTFRAINLLNAVLIICLTPFDARWGLLFNASMSGCFAAVMLPLFFGKNKWETGASILAVLLTARHMSLGILGLTFLLWLIRERDYKYALIYACMGLMMTLGAVGDMIDATGGRYLVWKKTMGLWIDQANYFSGAGLGTFYVLGKDITAEWGTQYVWLHSDWLQTIFEQGIMGTVAACIFYTHTLYKSRFNTRIFMALTAYGACALANMPLRYPVFGMFGVYLVKLALEVESDFSLQRRRQSFLS